MEYLRQPDTSGSFLHIEEPAYSQEDAEFLGGQASVALNEKTPQETDATVNIIKNNKEGLRAVRGKISSVNQAEYNEVKRQMFNEALERGDRDTAIALLKIGFGANEQKTAMEETVADKGTAEKLTVAPPHEEVITSEHTPQETANALVLGNFLTEMLAPMDKYQDPTQGAAAAESFKNLGQSFDRVFTQEDWGSPTELPADVLKFALSLGDASRVFTKEFFIDLLASFINFPTAGAKGDYITPGSAMADIGEAYRKLPPEELRKVLESKREELLNGIGGNALRAYSVAWDLVNTTEGWNTPELQEQFELLRSQPTLSAPALDAAGKEVYDAEGNLVYNEIPNPLYEEYAQGGPRPTEKFLRALDEVFSVAGVQDVVDSPLMDVLGGAGLAVKTLKVFSRLALMVRTFGHTATARAVLSRAAKGSQNTAEVYRHLTSVVNKGTHTDPKLAAEVLRIQRETAQIVEDIPVAPRAQPTQDSITGTLLNTATNPNHFTNEMAHAFHEVSEGNNYISVLYRGSDGVAFSDKAAAEAWAASKHLEDFEVVPDSPAGGFLVKIRTPLSDAGHYTGGPPTATWLENIRQMFGVGKIIFTPNTTSSVEAGIEASAANLRVGQFRKAFDNLMSEVGYLGSKKGKRLEEILNIGKQTPADPAKPNELGKWFTDEEYIVKYQHEYGELPTFKERKAYAIMKEASNLAYAMVNKGVHDQAASLGVTKWVVQNDKATDAILGIDKGREAPKGQFLARLPDGTVTDDTSRVSSAMKDPDIFVIKLHGEKLYNGKSVTHMLFKRGDIKDVGLPKQLLNYTEGGARVYADPWFAKARNQSRVMTLMNFGSKKEAKAWVAKMNTARGVYNDFLKDFRALKKSGMTAVTERALRARYDARLQAIDPVLKTTYLDKKVADGMFDPASEIYALFDRQKFPGEGTPDVVDTNLVQANGRMFYSHRGEHLTTDNGTRLATLANPFSTLSYQIAHASRVAGYSDFALKEMQTWANRYKGYLAHDTKSGSLADIFLHGEFPVNPIGMNIKQVWMAEAERAHIKRILRQPSKFDDALNTARMRAAEGIAEFFGDRTFLGKKYFESLRNGRVADADVVNFWKGWAYDLHMGLFNVTHLWLQALGASAAVAMHPIHGAKALLDTSIMWPMQLVRISDKGVDIMDSLAAKSGAYARGEFKEIYKTWKKTGLHNVRSTDTTLDDLSKADGVRMGWVWSGVRNTGRFFVYEGERFARMTTFHIARRMADEEAASGAFAKGSDAYIKFIQGKSNALQLGMMSGMEAAWTRNPLTALGFQMLQYPIKATETFLGLNRQLSSAEKYRFIAGSAAMWGAYGVPFGPQLLQKYAESRGEKMSEEDFKTLLFGGIDKFIRMVFNVDAAFAAKLGYGDFHVSFIADLVEHDLVSFFGGIALGDFVKLKDTAPAVYYALAAYVTAAEKDKVSLATASATAIAELGDVLASANLARRAYVLYHTGILTDTSGSRMIELNSKYEPLLQAAGVPSAQEAIGYLEYQHYKASAAEVAKISVLAAEKLLDSTIALSQGDKEKSLLHAQVAWLLTNSLDLDQQQKVIKDMEKNLNSTTEIRARVSGNRLYKEEDGNADR